jgi:hypothetical protein
MTVAINHWLPLFARPTTVDIVMVLHVKLTKSIVVPTGNTET